jgi:hypothetical protein
MSQRFTPPFHQQALALGLAAMLTILVLGALDVLASRPADAPQLAASPAASQVTLVQARPGTRS